MRDDRIYVTELALGENGRYERILTEVERRARIHYNLEYYGDSEELETRLVVVIGQLPRIQAEYALTAARTPNSVPTTVEIRSAAPINSSVGPRRSPIRDRTGVCELYE